MKHEDFAPFSFCLTATLTVVQLQITLFYINDYIIVSIVTAPQLHFPEHITAYRYGLQHTCVFTCSHVHTHPSSNHAHLFPITHINTKTPCALADLPSLVFWSQYSAFQISFLSCFWICPRCFVCCLSDLKPAPD